MLIAPGRCDTAYDIGESASTRTNGSPLSIFCHSWSRLTCRSATAISGDDAVHLEDLGVLAVHVDPVRAGDVPDVLGVGVPAVLLRRVLRQRRRLSLDVPVL